MRPIDGDMLDGACNQLADELRQKGQKTDALLLEALAAVVNFCPTLDVEPIKHGHWVQEYDDGWRCSVCSSLWTFLVDRPEENGADYCPVCGAKMDEEPAAVVDPADVERSGRRC